MKDPGSAVRKSKNAIKQTARTAFSFPGMKSSGRNQMGLFLRPKISNINAQLNGIRALTKTLGSKIMAVGTPRESAEDINASYRYSKQFFAPDKILYVVAPAARESFEASIAYHKCRYIYEDDAISFFDVERIKQLFGVDMAVPGKGRGIAMALAYAYRSLKNDWVNVRYVNFGDVDVNFDYFRPDHFLAASVQGISDEVIFGIIAQNTARRYNSPLTPGIDAMKVLGEFGRHYANFLQSLVWRLAGEYWVRWDLFAGLLPAASAYTLEVATFMMVWDYIHSMSNGRPLNFVQVANPFEKRDGARAGQNPKPYEWIMYTQICRGAMAVIETARQSGNCFLNFRPQDYKLLNRLLIDAGRGIDTLPDVNEADSFKSDHGPNLKHEVDADCIIPPAKVLFENNCLRL